MTQGRLSLVSGPETFQLLHSTKVLFSKSTSNGRVSFQCLFTCVHIWMDTIYLGNGSWKLSEWPSKEITVLTKSHKNVAITFVLYTRISNTFYKWVWMIFFQGNSITHLGRHTPGRSEGRKDAKSIKLWCEYVQSTHCWIVLWLGNWYWLQLSPIQSEAIIPFQASQHILIYKKNVSVLVSYEISV